jgi:hypothetical protein
MYSEYINYKAAENDNKEGEMRQILPNLERKNKTVLKLL